MAGEPTIKGTTVIIGFPTGESVTGIVRDTYDKETTADIEFVRDENNNEATALVSNLGMRIVVEGHCSAAVTILKGDTVTVNSIKYVCENAVARHSRLATRFSLTLYKPAQMTIT